MQDPSVTAAEAYESLFVPALFGAWAPKLADAAALAEGERGLDVACRTGVLARAPRVDQVVRTVLLLGGVVDVEHLARSASDTSASPPT